MKVTVEELRKWNACVGGLDWFTSAFPSGEADWADFAASAPRKDWVAWTACSAGLDWPDSRYTPDIATVLIETKDARYLYYAGLDWPDDRWTPEIATALIETKDAKYLYLARRYWLDRRLTLEIIDTTRKIIDAGLPPRVVEL